MIATAIFSKRLAAWATALGLATMLPILAQAGPAPKMCIPAATGVAGQSGPPDWITPGQTATDSYVPTDPRWRGSLALDFAFSSATTAHESDVEFRALSDPGKSYFVGSWFIETAPDIVRNQTTLWLGLSPNVPEAAGLIVQITLSDTSTGLDDGWMPASSFTLSAFQSDGAGHWTQMATPPTWIAATTRVWINTAGTDGSTKTRWAVQMKVPFADPSVAITNTNSFLMWHDAQIDYVYGGGAASALIPYTWPRSTSANVPSFVYHMDTSTFPATAVYPATSNWGEFSLADPATAGCAGISLATGDIGTTNAGGSRMNLTTPNTFFAKPSSTQNTAVPSGVLTATFRIANWGSQVGETTATSWQSPPTLTDVVDGAGIAAWSGTPPAPHGDIEGNWTLSVAERCPFTGQVGVTDEDGNFTPGSPSCPNVNPTSELHQCMLVELKGPGQNFLSSSAFRNMDFVHASTFSRQAEISVVGLPSTPAHQRDVYLYVEHENMPATVSSSPSSGTGQTGAGGDQNGGGKGGVPGQPGVRAVSTGGGSTVDTSTMPTLIVHGYHDTGMKVSIAGQDHILLLPQTSYGYYVTHEGPLNGWSDSIQGAQRLSEVDHYKVGVPDNGSVRITNTIEAIETSRWAAWLGLGATIPHGSFSNNHDGGFVGTLGLEYAIDPQLSVEATLAAHHFDGKNGADAIDVTAFGVDAKYYVTSAPLRWFVDGGIGLYAFDPGSTRFGGTIGGGVQYGLGHGWSIEGRYNLQSVTSNAPDTTWSTLQVAVRKAF